MAPFIDRKFERKATGYIIRVSLKEAYKVIVLEERDPNTQLSGVATIVVRSVMFDDMRTWHRVGLHGIASQQVIIAKNVPPVVATSLLEMIPALMNEKRNHNHEELPWEVIPNER